MDRAVTFEAVLPNGEILRTGSQVTKMGAELNPYVRYANGPDIAGLFRGSMGNFGLITKMVIRLRPLAEIEKNYYFAFKQLEPVLRAMKNIERLEITRYSHIYNRSVGMRCTAVMDDLITDEKREKLLASMPEYTLVIGLGGNSKMITLYEELVRDEVKRQGGEEIRLEEKYMENLDALSEGTSQSILRMFAPHGGYGAIIAMLPISKVPEVHNTIEEIVKKHDLRDPFTGKPLDTEIIVFSYDRCSIVYLEHELLYDTLDAEAIKKEMECIRECYAVLTRKFGACHTIPNRSLLRSMIPSYVDMLVGIKKLVDPNGIFLSGGPYTLEK
jgi:FAD/FMN-containing dehydrogenase